MAKLKWLPEALEDAERLHAFLRSKDVAAADKCITTILDGARLLKISPHLGRPMADGLRQRELFMSFGAGAYVLRYKLEDSETVVIVRVWHSREDRTSI
jgi:plasmid stabilization system protein ParE